MFTSIYEHVAQSVSSLASTGVSVSRSIYSWLTTSPSTTYYEPSPYLHQQSIIEDEKTGLRRSIYQYNEDEYSGLKVHRDLFEFSLSRYHDRPCFGKRDNFDSPADWLTYEEIDRRIQAVGSALTVLLANSTAQHAMIGICGPNSQEWVVTQQACGAYSMVCVPLYDSLGDESLEYIVGQTQLTTIVCDRVEQAKWFIQQFSDQLMHVIVINHNDDFGRFRESCDCKTKLISFQELIELGKANLIPTKMASEDDLCLICYTSGTSGQPKGAMFTHIQYVNNMRNMALQIKTYPIDLSSLVHISYLPLSHMLEQTVMSIGLMLGAKIGFLTDGQQGLLQDFKYYKPSLFITVPRILSRIESNTRKSINNSNVKKYILNSAIDQKMAEQRLGIYKEEGLLDSLIFKKLREEFGGNIRVVITGSAPLTRGTHQFIRTAFCCPVIEGYGTTEASAVISLGLLNDLIGEHCGALTVGVKVVLMDVPEMDIYVERDGVGEICVLSRTCISGYYKDEENTKKLFHDNGCLRTGDIGCWTELGQLKIVDRCKSMFKLCQGEYIAPAKVEGVYSMCPLVAQIFVDGNSLEAFPIAIIVPEMETLRRRCTHLLSKTNNIIDDQPKYKMAVNASQTSTLSDEDICSHPIVRQLVVDELRDFGKKGGLKGFEQVKFVYLTSEPFTEENQLLTRSMKTVRSRVRKRYADIINRLYAEGRN